MGVREEVEKAIKEGLTPSVIAVQRGVSLDTIFGYINQKIGSGHLRRSDVLFTIPIERRQPVLEIIKKSPSKINLRNVPLFLESRNLHLDQGDVETVLRYGDRRFVLGDLYIDVMGIELNLHSLIQEGLTNEFGPGEDGWWSKGIPLTIRQSCMCRREEDPERLVPYCYVDIVDMKTIIDRNWGALATCFPTIPQSGKKQLLDDLMQFNRIRRAVMHPVRTPDISERDFDFIMLFKRQLGFI